MKKKNEKKRDLHPLFSGTVTIHALAAERVLYCADRSRKGFYLLYLQQCETSRYTAPQPFTPLFMDPLVLTPARQRGEKKEDEWMTKIFHWKREEGDENEE